VDGFPGNETTHWRKGYTMNIDDESEDL